MINYRLKSIKNIFLRKARNLLFDEFPRLSYSRAGEDLVINEIFKSKGTGTYIDIGCHDPIKNSNSYLFYNKGWRGLNIDANEEKINLLNIVKPLDVNINLAVSSEKGEIEYLEIEGDDSMNTTKTEFYNNFIKDQNYNIKKKSFIRCDSLKNILETHLEFSEIDFMTIDVEGSELEILNSNNWNKFKPKVLLIETEIENFDFVTNPIFKLLNSLEYATYSVIAMSNKLANIVFIDKHSDIYQNLYGKQ